MRLAQLLLMMFALAGCSDVVTTRFATLSEAKAMGAFERGWLPPLMPGSARAILERNDLDLNSGTGAFEYDAVETTGYVDALAGLGAVARVEGAVSVVTVATNGSQWEIRLNRGSGSAEWTMRRP